MRIRGRDMVRCDAGPWRGATTLYGQATQQPRNLGPQYSTCAATPLTRRLVRAKRPARGRHDPEHRYGRRRAGRTSRKCARGAREPWLLAASRQLDHLGVRAASFNSTRNAWASKIVPRHQELAPRPRFARHALAHPRAPANASCSIGHLAAFVQRLIGEQAKEHQLELNFMATRRTTRAGISVLTLARRIVLSDSSSDWLDRLTPWAAIPLLRDQAINACAKT